MKDLYSHWTNQTPENCYHGICPYFVLKDVYGSCYMNLATQNSKYHVTKRTYDILGSQGFVLTYNTGGINEEFENGKDLIAVNSTEEALYYIEYYTKHIDEYNKIKENGYKKVMTQYTYKHRLQGMLGEIGVL